MRVRHALALGLLGLLLAAGSVLADTAAVPQLDRGLTEIEAGGVVPLNNRPLPVFEHQRDRMRRQVHFGNLREYAPPDEFGVLIEFDGTRAELEAAGIRVGTQAGSTFTARVRRDEIGRLRGVPGIRKVQLSRYLRPHLNVSAADVTADLEHAASGTPPVYAGRAGAGIIIGDVDTGIDFTSSEFLGSDGTTRILYIWDQNDATGTEPAEFAYGSEWTKLQIDELPGSITHEDANGHGTNVAGVLVGNGSSTGCSMPAYRYVGVAPEAQFIEVATDFTDAGIIDGVSYIFQKAALLGKDCVVNISLGGSSGPHDGSDAFTSAIDALTGPGKIVVASAGNTQEDNIHGKLTTTSTTAGVDKFVMNVPSYTYNTDTYNDYILIAGWYDPTASVVVQIKGPNAADTLSCGYGSYRSRSSGTTGCTMYIANMNSAQGFGGTSTTRQFEIEIYDATASQRPRIGNWTINVISNGSGSLGARVDTWIYAAYLDSAGVQPTITTGLDLTTMVGEPACGDSVIAVAAHSTKASWYSCGSGATYSFSPAPTLNDIAPFSSIGPRRDGVLKPEISAPGFGVATTHSSFAGDLAGTGWDVDDGVHEITAGTSFSAPHVSGAAALYLQAYPGASPSEVKLAFEASARTDAYTGTVPNATWGYGKLDIYNTLDHVGPTVAVTSPNTGVAWKAGSSHDITWTASDASGVDSVILRYSTDGGATYPNVIATGLANSGSYAWTVPNDPTSEARVRVTAYDHFGNSGTDVSDADFTIDRWTITASAGPGGTITPSGAVPVVEGASQHFSIQAATGYHVLDVLVDGGSAGADTGYTFTNVNADHTISATFSADLYTLTTNAGKGGTVTRVPDQTAYAAGTPVTITAVPDSAWSFASWSGDTSTTGNPLEIVVQDSRTMTASFFDIGEPVVALLAPAGGTTLTIGGTAAVTWTALDNDGVARVDVLLSRTGLGGAFDTVGTDVPNTGSYEWTVTGPVTEDAFFRVVARDTTGNAGADANDEAIAIHSASGVDGEAVTALELAPVQPNPVRGAGLIRFALPVAGHVRLSVMDVQGREVTTLADGFRDPGRYQIRWDGTGRVGPGLYFVRLNAGGRTLVRRTVVTR